MTISTTSNIVKVNTPTPPTITTDEKKAHRKKNPLNTVRDLKGNDITKP